MSEPPRLAPGTPMQQKAPDEARTMTRSEPHQPVSKWHRVRWWLGHHMARDAAGEWKGDAGWAGSSLKPSKLGRGTRDERRADLRLAQHAQDLRAEAASGGNKRERRAFYGDANESAVGPSERRVRATAGDDEQARYERAQADHWYFKKRGRK